MSKAANTPDGITHAGLVKVDDDRKLSSVPLFFCNGKWYGPNREGGYSRYRDAHAGSLVAEYGFNRINKTENGSTHAERALLWLMQNRSVDYAGPLAGWPCGAYQMGEDRVLVTEALRMVTPKAGKWDTIKLLLQTLLDDADHDQISIVYVWLSVSLRHLVARMAAPGTLPFQHCPALALFGERESGKSALIDLVLTPLFGGRRADPLDFLKVGKFNKDLFPAALLVLDDKGASANLEARREMGDKMKSLIWTEFQRMEGKGADAEMVAPFWRLILAGNNEDSSLNICPALNDSLRDKIVIAKTQKADGLPTCEKTKAAWVKALREELPAFAHFLLHWKVPKRLKLDTRSGVVNFWHPEIAGALLEKQPECKALEVINLLFKLRWEGTATDFYGEVRERDKGGHYENLFKSIEVCGRMLAELGRTTPGRVTRTPRNGVSRYTIEPEVKA